MAGEYTPQFKVGYTVLSAGEEIHYVIFGTYRSLGQFSPDFAGGHSDYDERDKNHVLYGLFDTTNIAGTCWRWERDLSLYCCNPTRGKKILLETKHLNLISQRYSIYGNGLFKFIDMLSDKPAIT